jgi:plastocyanin
MKRTRITLLVTGLTLVLGLAPLAGAQAAGAQAAEPVKLSVTIRDHRFDPAELRAPAGVAIEITVTNADATPEEFESKALRIEKVVAGSHDTVFRLRPLAAGRYGFVGEYHEDTAKGVLVIGDAK